MKASKAQQTFLYDELLPNILSSTAPGAINLRDEFRGYIRRQGVGDMRSLEVANDQFGQLVESLERHMADWDAQGIPRPLTETDQDYIFLAWPHVQFLRYSGLTERIDDNFCELFGYIRTLDGKQFLVVCALWLKCVGFKKIFICDARGDEGVDVLGLLEEGGLRSLVAVVQAKTSKEPIGRGLVLTEYGKYQMLPHTERYIQYRRALELDSRVEGVSWSYMILANQSFNWGARTVASKLGILLRSVHQLSFLLAQRYSRAEVENAVNRLSSSIRVDLEANFFDRLGV